MRALIALLLLAFVATTQAEWRIAPNADALDRPAYWVADVNGVRVEAILNDYRVTIGTQCLGAEVRPAGALSLRWLDVGPNPLAGMCRWVSDGTAPPDPPADPVLRDIDVTWDPPTTRADGTPLVQLTAYTIYPAHDGAAQEPVHIDDGTLRSYRVENLPPGEWCFEVTAWEGALESARSSPPACTTL